MVDTITESFCERCGTRYEFKAPTRLNPLRKTRGLLGGLKNYVMSQDALGDAIGDAMRSEEEQLASAQLEAFHESFNFCIDCRQYTCVNCWNDDAGRCRSCAPIPGTDDLAERLAASMASPSGAALADPMLADPLYTNGANGGAVAPLGTDAWPTSDLPDAPSGNGHPPAGWPEEDGFVYQPEPEPTDEPVRAADGFVYESPDAPLLAPDELDPASVWSSAARPPQPELAPEPEPVVAELEPEPVAADLEPEPTVAEVEPEPEPEPVVAEIEPEPEPVVAEAEYEPEPVVAEVDPDAYIAADLDFDPYIAAEAEPVVEPVAAELEVEPEPEPMVAGAELQDEPPRLRVVAWDEDAAYDLEPEPIVAHELVAEPIVAEVEPEPEPVVAEVEPAVEAEPEPIVAEVEAEPEPV
ncbi:MAG: hypothetical protein M3Y29_02615, partial [Chloroflexota bacterium]|nr:hypothetical protein [Chloroflexota bacterium]